MAWREGFPYAPEINSALLAYKEGLTATQPSYRDAVARWYSGATWELGAGSVPGSSTGGQSGLAHGYE